MKNLFRLAASLIAASVLAACSSGGNNGLPPHIGNSARQMHSMTTIVCNGDPTSGGTVCYHNQPAPDPGAPAPGGYGCIQNCSGQPPVGMPGPGGMGGASNGCVTLASGHQYCPGTVATAYPTVGAPCDGAQAHGIPIDLGTSNLPGGTNGAATSVVNIYSIQNANDYVAGWVYKTENGNYFWEGNPNAMPALNSFASILPVFGPVISGISDATNSPRQVSQNNLNTIVKASSTGTFHEHHCFSNDLPSSDLG